MWKIWRELVSGCCAPSVNEIQGLPAIPEDVCLVRERLQKLHQESGESLRYLLMVNRQAGPVALSEEF